jgi:hypothetical protein
MRFQNRILWKAGIALCMLCFSFQAGAQTSKFTSELLSAKGKTLKLHYAKMALTAKLVGTAVNDPNWFNWCVSPIQGMVI